MHPRTLLTAAILLGFGTVRAQGPNILLVVGDDIGVDRVGAYREHRNPGRTPTLDWIASHGVMFRNAWSNPLCSPARAALMTGRYSYRTGVGMNLTSFSDETGLSLDETTLPEILPAYSTAALGKWHLGSGHLHPNQSGFSHFAGSLRNLDRIGIGNEYYKWTKLTDGLLQIRNEYATTDTADETIEAIETLPQPWFVYCAFNAPNEPYHYPPSNLHGYALSGEPWKNPPLFARAMTEAMDSELARILQSVPPNTWVIFVGDNGTANEATDGGTPPSHSKGTVYEGGVNVPLIITGPGVVPGECRALVNTTDLFATIADLAGVPSSAEDSVSLLPYLSDPKLPSLREWVFAESFG